MGPLALHKFPPAHDLSGRYSDTGQGKNDAQSTNNGHSEELDRNDNNSAAFEHMLFRFSDFPVRVTLRGSNRLSKYWTRGKLRSAFKLGAEDVFRGYPHI
jgi:hypothetical protein